MDAYELTTKLTESLAWPVVAVIAMFVFRRDAKAGLERLRKLDAFGVKAEFDELKQLEAAIDKVEDKVEDQDAGVQHAPPEPGEPPQEDEAPEDGPRYSVSADQPAEDGDLTPDAVILTEWAGFERFMRLFYQASNLPSTGSRPPSMTTILTGLMVRGVFRYDTMQAIKYAQEVRNKVAHGVHRPSRDEAQRYKLALKSLRLLMDPHTRG